MLENRVCIVAGGGHGIGRATAIELANHGATVVVNDLGSSEHGEGESEEPAQEVADTIREEGGEAMAHFGDVADLEYTQSLIDDTVSEYGDVHSIANFAGILRDRMSFNMTEEEWDAVIDVHLKGHFAIARNAAAYWREQSKEVDGPLDPQRSFLLVSSVSGLGSIGQLNYSAAKAGVLGMTRTLSRELYRYGVRVNALMPSAFTRLIETMPEQYQPDEEDRIPPEELAPFNAYVLSDAAEDITGCTLRNAGPTVGVYSDPELRSSAYSRDGWTVEELAERFQGTVGADYDLTNVGAAVRTDE